VDRIRAHEQGPQSTGEDDVFDRGLDKGLVGTKAGESVCLVHPGGKGKEGGAPTLSSYSAQLSEFCRMVWQNVWSSATRSPTTSWPTCGGRSGWWINFLRSRVLLKELGVLLRKEVRLVRNAGTNRLASKTPARETKLRRSGKPGLDEAIVA